MRISFRSSLLCALSDPNVFHIHLKPSGVLAAPNCLTLPDLSLPNIFGNALLQTVGLTVSISSANTNAECISSYGIFQTDYDYDICYAIKSTAEVQIYNMEE